MSEISNLSDAQIRLLEDYDPAIKDSGISTLIDALISSNNGFQTALALAGGDEILHAPGLAPGTTNTDVAHNALDYTVNGVCYKLAANASGVDPEALTATASGKFNGWRLEVGVNGTVDLQEDTGVEDAGYDTAAEALAAIQALAATADHAIIGYVVIGKAATIVTPGTTALVANDNALFYKADTLFEKQAAAVA